MYYEEVIIEPGNTISGLGVEYGYKASQWPKIWDDPRNADLKKKRGLPQKIQPGDVVKIPIPWKVVSKTLNADANGALMLVNRDGEPGKRLSWVQTVYRHNQPIGPNPAAHCVDGCTPDDNLPFYWTDAAVDGHRDRRSEGQFAQDIWRSCEPEQSDGGTGDHQVAGHRVDRGGDGEASHRL
jgi:hypothetical protein